MVWRGGCKYGGKGFGGLLLCFLNQEQFETLYMVRGVGRCEGG